MVRPLLLRLFAASVPLLGALALSGCPRVASLDEDLVGPVCDETTDGPWGGVVLRGGVYVDILFVIDNSGSMAEQQVKLNQGIDALFERLDEVGVDYRVGFTTSDNGNPWCIPGTTTPEGGKLVLSSCEQRLDDFIFNNGAIDASDIACTQQCALDSAELAITPTSTDFDTNEAARPWLQNGPPNLPPGTDPVEAFKCFAPQGISGCGFESQLESMYLALRRAEDSNDDSYGFLRWNAMLAVVILTDEADCSYNKEWSDIFAQDGNRVFWEDPSQSFPSSAVCWNAGVSCSGDPSGYDSCEPADFNLSGDPTEIPSDAVLHPLSRYRDLLKGIEQQKQELNSEQQLLLTVIAGVEGGGEDWSVSYADSQDPDTQLAWGIAPGCTGADALIAVPPVRMRALAEGFEYPGLYSACAPDHSQAMASLGDRIAAEAGPTCYPRCAADGDRSTPQLEPRCTVDIDSPGIDNREQLSDCARGDDGAYLIDPETETYEVPEGEDMCYAMLVDRDGSQTFDANDQLSAACVEAGANLEFVLARRPGYFEPGGSYIRADCLLTDCYEQFCGG